MNIKEIIDKERWGGSHGATTSRTHNACLDNIEANVTACVAELEAQWSDFAKRSAQDVEFLKQRIADLEAQLRPSDGGEFERMMVYYRFALDTTVGECTRSYLELAHNADRAADRGRITELETAKDNYKQMVVAQKQRIAELEAQAPKVVKPQILPVLDRKCECGAALDYAVNYCNNCGAKLVWREA